MKTQASNLIAGAFPAACRKTILPMSRQRKRIIETMFIVAALCLCFVPPAIAAPGSWTRKADMPAPAGPTASCVVDGILYVIGGGNPFNNPLRTVWAYNAQTDSWTRKADLPAARQFHAAAAVDGIIYVVGGGLSVDGPLVLPVAAYDPRTDTWVTNKANIPTGRGCLAACAVDRIIYLFGGMTESMAGSFDFTLAYDPAEDRFTARRKMPRTRLAAGSCGVIDGKVYLAGGASEEPVVNSDYVFYKILDVFDPRGGVAPQILRARLVTSNSFRLAWQGEAGIKYGVESSPDVLTNRWTRVHLARTVASDATRHLYRHPAIVVRTRRLRTCPILPSPAEVRAEGWQEGQSRRDLERNQLEGGP
jgi:hypothetical protein